MDKARSRKKPTFYWQAILIVLPVIALAGVGLASLRQDRQLAESEATERAQRIAADLWTQVRNGVVLKFAANTPETRSATNSASPTTAFQVPARSEIPAPPPTRAPLPQALQIHRSATNSISPTTAFQVSAQGELLVPLPIGALDPQTLQLHKLSETQTRVWERANTAEFSNDREAAVNAYDEFVRSGPPAEFAARAYFALGLLAKPDDVAKQNLEKVRSDYPKVLSDAGLSMAQLAWLKLLEMAFQPSNKPTAEDCSSLGSFCRQLVETPNSLTPPLLRKASEWVKTRGLACPEVTEAQRAWEKQELARRVFEQAKPFLATPALTNEFLKPKSLASGTSAATHEEISVFWAGDYLAIKSAPSGWVSCTWEDDVRQVIIDLLRAATSVPDYFGVSIELAGKTFVDPNSIRPWHQIDTMSRKGGGTRKSYDEKEAAGMPAAIAAFQGTEGDLPLKINVRLTSSAELFRRQRARTFWFCALISFAALTALVGLVTAWRAFHRQSLLHEMKSNFVSSVSHELRAPIASVRLLAEGLERGKIAEPQKQKEYYRFIVQECRRLSSLIENVLDFSRIEQGRKRYEFEPTDLSALVEQTVKLLEPYALERGVKLEITASQLSTLNSQPTCDGLALQQALVNLIDNAIKHSPAGRVVKIGLDGDADKVSLWVEDNGAGIPSNEHQKIFEQFYRRGSELRRETQGVGIGLTIVKHIAEAHSGRVIVRSAPGEGSRFTIELPVKNETPETDTK